MYTENCSDSVSSVCWNLIKVASCYPAKRLLNESENNMKTIFDLREKQDSATYENVKNLYGEPLKIVQLGEQSIKPCIGCWNCWLKTPGRCTLKDQMTEIHPDYMCSDTVILLMDTAQGSISYFVQSGFPESSQSHYLEAYFENLALRLKRDYLGTAIKGGVEGMQVRSPKAQGKIIEPMAKIISHLVNEGSFNSRDLARLARPVQFGSGVTLIFKILARTGLTNYFWDLQLKENNVFDQRFACPYQN